MNIFSFLYSSSHSTNDWSYVDFGRWSSITYLYVVQLIYFHKMRDSIAHLNVLSQT